jgi:ribonucleoside-diphosphate reductase alpha chain
MFFVKKIPNILYRVYREIGDRSKTKKICKEQAKEITAKYFESNEDIEIETIQDDVENYLMEIKQFLAAKAFIKYREKKTEERKNP